MRISFVVTALVYGGAEQQVVALATTAARRGHTVEVVSLLPPRAHVETLEGAGVEVHSLRMRRRLPDPRGILRLARELRRFRPDVVHSHMAHANLLARVTRPFAPVPVLICTAHNVNEAHNPRAFGWMERAYRLTDRLCDLTTNVSEAAVTRYIEKRAAPSHRIRRMPNGIDTERWRPRPEARARLRQGLRIEDRRVLLAVGRFDRQKNHAGLVDALARVVERCPDAVLLCAGSGPLEAMIRARVHTLRIGPHVRFLGTRDDVPDLMNAADAFVLGSDWEGLPMVLLEAAATGLPVVATDVGGNGEIVESDVTGLLVPPGDPRALAEALVRVLELPEEERRAMGAAGRARVEREFGLDRVMDRWEAIYAEMRRSRGSTAAPRIAEDHRR